MYGSVWEDDAFRLYSHAQREAIYAMQRKHGNVRVQPEFSYIKVEGLDGTRERRVVDTKCVRADGKEVMEDG